MGRSKTSDKTIAAALVKAMGNVSLAARHLRMERTGISVRISKSLYLQQILHDARESMVDNAESALNRSVLSGEAWAVCFTLKTQGKARGYVERQEVRQVESIQVEIAEEIVDAHQARRDAATPDAG